MCSKSLLLQQFLDNMPGAELFIWVSAAELKPVLRSNVLCLASNEPADGNKIKRIYVAVHLRAPLIQQVHCETYAGYFGFKRTLANLQQRYIWGTMWLER